MTTARQQRRMLLWQLITSVDRLPMTLQQISGGISEGHQLRPVNELAQVAETLADLSKVAAQLSSAYRSYNDGEVE